MVQLKLGYNWTGGYGPCYYDLLILIVVDCGSLTDPANGSFTLTSGTFGVTATYSCDTGYTLVGNSSRTCQTTGNWSGSAPTCQSMLLNGGHFACLRLLVSFYPLEGYMREQYIPYRKN